MKKNEGITLIALVITIIVLLILAGVAIAMLSGENGILKKAAEAKTKTEEGQKKEEAALATAELETYLLTNNSKYKCRYGYITGIEEGDTVDKLENALPNGYKVVSKYEYDDATAIREDKAIEESEKNTINISTGMAIVKDGKEVARTVLIADVNCDAKIKTNDYAIFKRKTLEIKENFRKAAMDLNCDGKVNGEDLKHLKLYFTTSHELEISQNQYVSNQGEVIIDRESLSRYIYVQKVFEGGSETNIYSLVYDQNLDFYDFKMKTNETKVEDFLSTLPEGGKIKRNEEEIATTENVQNGDKVIYVNEEKEIYIGKIIIE
mgnify:CR=1 FL=1